MKRIFVSRSLKPSSPIRKIAEGCEIIAQSLIKFSALDFEEPKADWIFFYSRNGVKYFFENSNYHLYPYLWACMSKGTAEELSQYVTDISFVGEGGPKEVAQTYQAYVAPDQITCFVRAENSLDSIHKTLNNLKDFSIPVYLNIPVENAPDQDFDILIFTSPMNVDVWMQNRKYNQEIIISIGQTTADHLKTYGIDDVIVADAPSETAIAKCLGAVV